MSIYGDTAEAAFYKGYNCAQSVAVAFAAEMGLSEEQALKLSSGFGGGFGRLREVCGAFSGVTMVLGAIYASTDPKDKTALYTEVQALAEKYRQGSGKNSIVCRELLGLSQAEGSPVASPRTPEYYQKRPCPQLIRMAAELMADYLAQHPDRAPVTMQTKMTPAAPDTDNAQTGS